MSLWQVLGDHFWPAVVLLGFMGAACVVSSLWQRARLPHKEKFGLILASRSGSESSYEGGLDGVKVRLDLAGEEGWITTWEGDCASGAELFAHRPVAAFDRPLRSLLGPLSRLETPGTYGKGWSFYGAPAAAAGLLAARLPGSGPASPWHRIELGGGRLEASLEGDGEMSRERLQEQADAFRELLAAVRG